MNTTDLIFLVPLFPLLGFILCGLVGKKAPKALVGGVATLCVAISFVCAVLVFMGLLRQPAEARHFESVLYNWMSIPAIRPGGQPLNLDIAFLVDPLSITLTLIITGIGALIHFYAMGYMSDDPRYSRFFSILNLFVAFMLVLVLANSFTLMFVGWEGVGLASYLLIGFWWEDISNSRAGTKAFIVNRVGDFGFLLAMFWIFAVTGSLTFSEVFSAATTGLIGPAALLGITLLLFLGATGKSAQIPLFVWLPDAMAGPTPVSALIHAATMVTAGVYLVARCHVLFSAVLTTQMVVAGIGVATAFFAATIALTQYDMKKVLAYSTISQLGYMFVGVGVGAYAAGVFHLMTHAFFKACLFLGAGAVMHALANRIDMREMGNLKKYMPITRITYLVAVIAIAGIPPLAGFWSKDEVLAGAFDRGGFFMGVWAIGLLTAFLTSLYMFRSYFLAFEGEERIDWAHLKHAHEHGHGHGGEEEHVELAPVTLNEREKAHLIHELPGMNFVLVVLAIGSAVAGVFGVSALFPNLFANLSFHHWLEPALSAWWAPGAEAHAAEAAGEAAGHSNHMMLAAISTAAALGGLLVAWMQHQSRTLERAGLPQGLFAAFASKYKVDELYNAIFQKGGLALGVWLWQIFDARVIDGIVNGTAVVTGGIGSNLRRWNTGFVRSYAFSILVGAVIIIGYLVLHAFSQGTATTTARPDLVGALTTGGLGR